MADDSEIKGEVQKRGERRGEAVEKRPDGEAELDAARAEDRVPVDARTGQEAQAHDKES
jgi:hypothetical protein